MQSTMWANHLEDDLTQLFLQTAPSYLIIECKLQNIDCQKEGYWRLAVQDQLSHDFFDGN